ncbi:MAG: hypothetical protein JRH01_15635 [Deltaproteobacteria bacterium]|nr:hypothetical protein [Deltaproteobacteria bacterium]MBW2395634.1 hypothetical protein [Deltaproteobacteria bacterium]
MKVHRYSRWDGSQEEFSLDAKSALDALSELLMEGLDVDEALEWMRRGGFDLGGMNFRVMGAEELISELRERVQELLDRYRIDQSTEALARKLETILDREERAQREAHGLESQAVNEFMERRHGDHASLSDAIEAFRSHEFADDEAGEAYRELLDELDRLRELEEFQREHGERFQGDEAADYEKAQEIREQIQALQQMARDLASGNLQEISLDELRELLSEDGLQSFVMLRDMEQTLQDEGFLRRGDDGMELTPRAIRRIGAQALAAVYSKLRNGRAGSHETLHRGIATPRPDETRPWAFGDALDVHVVRTVLNGVKRAVAEGRPTTPVQLCVDDLEVRECDFSTQTTTILLLDMSWSMSWAGRFPAAKRVALALDHLIRTRYPRDDFFVVGFSTRARELPIKELPLARWDMGDPFTNLQDGLRVAERLISQHPSPSPQILVITDGQPTAYFEGRELRVEWPMGFGGVSPHAVAETLKTVRRVTRRGITINTFMLDDAPELVGFVERMTEINKGRAFFTMPNQLGTFLTVDYLAEKRSRFR